MTHNQRELHEMALKSETMNDRQWSSAVIDKYDDYRFINHQRLCNKTWISPSNDGKWTEQIYYRLKKIMSQHPGTRSRIMIRVRFVGDYHAPVEVSIEHGHATNIVKMLGRRRLLTQS